MARSGSGWAGRSAWEGQGEGRQSCNERGRGQAGRDRVGCIDRQPHMHPCDAPQHILLSLPARFATLPHTCC